VSRAIGLWLRSEIIHTESRASTPPGAWCAGLASSQTGGSAYVAFSLAP
jgi:hypothetical protein